MQASFKKVEEIKGAKKLENGYFVDLPYCPYCKQYVENLTSHLMECDKAQ